MRKLVVILCAPVDDLTMDEALVQIENFVEAGRTTGKTHQIATVNADFVVKAISDPELRHLLQEADMATADGMPLVWGSKLLGVPLRERVAGADMVPALAKLSAEKGYSLFFLGAAPGVATRAADILREQYHGTNIVGIISPPKSSILEMDQAIIEEIKKAKPDILLVAFGNPKQEKWIGMYGKELGVPVMMGVGGSFDFIAGETKRAPMWMQKSGLEWLFRLLQEPRRLWRRYVIDLVAFGAFFLRQWWFLRQKNIPSPLLPRSDIILVDDFAMVNLVGRLDINNRADFQHKVEQVLETTPNIIVNLAQTTFLDSSGIGTLVGIAKRARDQGGDLKLTEIPESIMKVITMLRLDKFFEVIHRIEKGLAFRKAVSKTTKTRAGKWSIYQIPRRFDAESAPEITEACSNLLQENPYLIIDFTDTAFLGSAGLAALMNLNRLATSQRGALRIAGCSNEVSQVIKMVRFDKVITIYQDIEAAASDNL